MIIGVDIRCLAERFRTGVGEYAYNLLRRLPQQMAANQLRYFSNAAKPVMLPEILAANVELLSYRVPSKIFNASVRLLHRPRLDAVCGADVIWLPSLQSVGVRRNTKLAVTFHDLSFVRYREFFSRRARLWHRLVNPRRLARRADAILATSEHTKNEVVGYYGIPAERVTVTPLGVDESFFRRADAQEFARVRRQYGLPERYILTVGNLEPRKNVATLLQAYSRLRPDADLVVVGRDVRGGNDLYRHARSLKNGNHVHFLGYVRAADRPIVYQAASIFVYPSYYEGFGLPVLEAMASGVPVIASQATSLPEVVGDAGILVDPYDVADLAEALTALLKDAGFCQRLAARGVQRAKQFSWQRTAEMTAAVINRLASA